MFQPPSGRMLLMIFAPPSSGNRQSHIVNAIAFPAETDAPLIVDANAVKPGPITLKGLQPVTRRSIQFFESGDRIDLNQFAHRYAGDPAPTAAHSCLEEHPGLS